MTTQTFLWPGTQEIPPLPLDAVHVFAWDLDVLPSSTDWAALDTDEALRARRFVFPRDRDRYVRAHSRMRALLAGYSGVDPEQLLFSNSKYGKPQLESPQIAEQLQFNLTHSGGIAALAIARDYQVGIDVEVGRPIDADVAEHHFSASELALLSRLPAEQWQAGFYRCWTSKEALLKGLGVGLNLPLDGFDVEVHPQRAPALLASRAPANFGREWLLVDLKPASGVVGTLAVCDHTGDFRREKVRCFSLSG